MTGKSFEIRVLDNGRDYMVWLNGELVGTGYYDRPEGTTGFRWGMYDSTLRHDALLFVSGATVRANVDPNEPYGLSVHYPMDGNVEDAGPAHYDGTLVGGSFTPSLVQHDQGLLMDGVDDYIEVPGFQGVTGATSRTCSAWIKTTQPSGEIMSWGSSDPGAKWIVRVDETGSLRSEVSGGYIYGTTPINDGLWHHVAAVLYSDSTPDISEVKLYVDGRLETIGDVLDESINTAAAQNVNIGVYSTVGARYFQGQIDDVRIYSYALAQEEIQSLASISPPQLDIIANDFIDLDDFVALAGYWLSDDCYSTALCDGRDLNADQVVNLEDFSELSKLWLCDLSVVDRVEDFEGYAVDTPMNGRISAGPLGGLWDVQDESNYNAVRAGVVATDADDPDNQVAKIENGHLIYRALSVSQLTDPIEEGESGILFFRFMYAENGANDDLEFHAGMHAFASDDNNPLTPENGNDLANFIAGFGASGTNGSTFDITTLDGATVLISGLNRYTWYDIWIIADNGSDTFDLYINPADGAAGPAGLLSGSPVATDVPFQTSTTQPLSGGLWVVGKSESSRGATVRLDEIAWSGEFLIP